MTAGETGIKVTAKGLAPAEVTVESTASVSGATGVSVWSISNVPGGGASVTIDGDVVGSGTGEGAAGVLVFSQLYGAATLTVNDGGSITAAATGSYVRSYYGDVTAVIGSGAEVSAARNGLQLMSFNNGTVSITVDGYVHSTGSSYYGIYGKAATNSLTLSIGAEGRVEGAKDAIKLKGQSVSATIAGEVQAGGVGKALQMSSTAGAKLELRSGYTITGGVAAQDPETDTLKLGGTETGAEADTFDVSKIDDGAGDPEQFQGFDTFEKVGTGDWTLTGSTEAVDDWAVKAGRLFVDGTMNLTAFDVASGATLGGTGTVGGVTLVSGSHVMPGSGTAPGTLTVDGDLDFVTGSIFDVTVNTKTASKLSVLGEATLGGATVSLRRADAETDYTNGKTYTILSATGGYTGTFSDTIDSDFVFLEASLAYIDDDVILTLIRNGIDFGSVVKTPNQRAAAQAIETLGGDIAGAITVLSEPEARQAFETLSGNTVALVPTLVAAEAESFDGLLRDRSASVETAAAGGPSALALAYGEAAESPDPASHATSAAFAAPSSAGFWLKGTGRFGALDGDGNGTGADYTMGGVTAGADTWLTPDLLAGIAFDYAAIDADFDGDAGSASVSSYALALYSRYRAGGLTLDGRLGYGVTENETRRRIVVGPDVATAAGDFDGDRFQAGFEAGYDLGRVAGTLLRPVGTLGYVRIGEDGFTETGAGIYGLTVDDRVTESLKSGLGFELTRGFAFGGRAEGLALSARALWAHEFLDDRATLDAAFSSDPSVGFTVDGATVARDSALIGLGATAQASDTLTLYARYDARLNPDQTDHAIAAGLRLDW